MLKLDIKKFKKISSDSHSTTMQNDQGHKIVIAHKALHPKVMEQLKGLKNYDQGGGVDSSPMIDPEKAEQMQKGATKSGADPQQWAKNIKESLGLQSKAHGGEIEQSNPKLEESKKTPPMTPEAVQMAKRRPMAEGGPVDETSMQVAEAPDAKDAMPTQQHDLDAVESYGPMDAMQEAAKFIGKKVLDNMTADTELYHADPQAWAAKHAMNMAMGTIGGGKIKTSFHRAAAAEKAGQAVERTAEQANNIEKGLTTPGEVQARIQPMLKNKGEVPPKFADGTGDVQPENASQQPSMDAELAALSEQQQPQAPQVPQQQTSAPMQAQQPQQAAPVEHPMPSLQGGYEQEIQGINKEAAAKGQLGAEQGAILDQAADLRAQQMAAVQKSYNDLNDERLAHMHDIQAGKVNPDKYWDNHSKLASGIGIILAGFNPRGDGNAALNFVQNNINRSIEAQAKNLQSDHNLLAANLQQFGNMRDAYTMTKSMMNDAITAKLDSAAAKATDPMVKARAMMLKGQLQRQVMPEFINLSMRKALIDAGTAQSGGSGEQDPAAMLPYLRQLAPETAKEWESRLVPSMNGQHSELAQVPLQQDVRDKLLGKQQLSSMARDMYDWSSKHSGSLDPATVATGKAKAAELQSLYRQAIQGGVFKKGEQDYIDNIIDSDPTKFYNNIRVLPKLKEIIDSNDKQTNVLRQSVGLKAKSPESNLTPQQQQFLQWARQNPKDPRAAVVFSKLGIQ